MNFLFISSRCKHCVQLQEDYLNSNNIQAVKIINIDVKQRPDFIKCVPSMVLDDGELLEGSKVFQYFSNINHITNNDIKATNSISYEQQLKFSDIKNKDSLLIPKLQDIL